MQYIDITWMNKEEPIAIFSDGCILTHRKSSFYILENSKRKKISTITRSAKDRIIENSRLLYRMFRRGVRCSCVNEYDETFFFCGRELYTFKKNRGLHKVYTLDKSQSIPLNIVIPYMAQYVVIWGEYSSNIERKAVNIVGITKEGKYKVIYTFEAGTIRHIHNIVKDIRGGYFIFTGDNDEKAGIYHADENFNSVCSVWLGEQDVRIVQGISTEEGLLYATDSVSNNNKVILLTFDDNNSPIKNVKGYINGSCIYGIRYGKGFLFSTTVESEENRKNRVLSLLSRKRGKGILTNKVDLVYVDDKYNNTVLFSLEKDALPYKLFQYGAIHFASGEYDGNVCICPMGVKKKDGRMGILKI